MSDDIRAEKPVLARADLIDMLAGLTGRDDEERSEMVDSMEIAWLAHCVEQRYGLPVDLTVEQLAGIRTVADAEDVLGKALAAARPAEGS
ncbi:hypothetical protein KGQ20_00080 [Catenulispora sp. NF23]|uniref:Carrier domain-containing protein n=1 Tax=Catenulispora pinistramenti TaxID=2705254 RepID=A0ABS5KI06_9ACTN|nr:hypothetical protein [Catenulispora pinistramenti]MBS2531162.1 hypothetical protein [Catenulispora pinistramenti]MBS2545924.1 hypothetical protein [Catenulispora pinistramenti]